MNKCNLCGSYIDNLKYVCDDKLTCNINVERKNKIKLLEEKQENELKEKMIYEENYLKERQRICESEQIKEIKNREKKYREQMNRPRKTISTNLEVSVQIQKEYLKGIYDGGMKLQNELLEYLKKGYILKMTERSMGWGYTENIPTNNLYIITSYSGLGLVHKNFSGYLNEINEDYDEIVVGKK